MERRLALEPGGTFTLNADIGSVTLTGDSTSGAAVTVTSRRDDFDELFDLRFDESPAGVTVSIKRRGGWLKGFWGGEWFGDATQIVIHVPSKTTANIRTSGGSIDATRLSGRLAVHTSGGSLQPKRSMPLSRGRPVAARSRCATWAATRSPERPAAASTSLVCAVV